MLFLPAKLMHQVFPFYECDEERVSITGNIHFDTSENIIAGTEKSEMEESRVVMGVCFGEKNEKD